MSARDTAVLRFAQYGQEPAQQKRQNGRLRVRHPGGRGGPDGGGARHPDPAVPAVVPTGVRPAGGTSPQPHLPGGVRFRRARTPRQDRTRGHQPESLCRGHGVHAHVRNIPGPSQPAAKERRNHSGPSKDGVAPVPPRGLAGGDADAPPKLHQRQKEEDAARGKIYVPRALQVRGGNGERNDVFSEHVGRDLGVRRRVLSYRRRHKSHRFLAFPRNFRS
mmetsp:Transcript_5365/g.11059  ORF Transcript_5365/g.11059 Transcript_5365/m.11059 type:complete len:219 (+) Transcript_5365:1164-1820(+)